MNSDVSMGPCTERRTALRRLCRERAEIAHSRAPADSSFVGGRPSRWFGTGAGWWGSAVLVAALGVAPVAHAQTVYVWNQTSPGDWTTASNWTPTRSSPNPNDVLVVNGTVTPSPTIRRVPDQTIGRLRIINGTHAILEAAADVFLTIQGGTGTDFEVAATSSLTVRGGKKIRISLTFGATGRVDGAVVFADHEHKLLADAPGAIAFETGATFTTTSTFRRSAFGNSGATDVVVFRRGSAYIHNGGDNPFGLLAPQSRVVFETGSIAIFRTTSGYESSGRTYANLRVENNQDLNLGGGGNFQVDTLSVESGSSFTHPGSGSSVVTIRGDLTGQGSGRIDLTAGSGGIALAGGIVQRVGGGGTGTIVFRSPATVAVGATLALSRTLTLTSSLTVNGALRLDPAGSVSGGSLAYGSQGTLIFNSTSETVVTSSQTYWPSASGPSHVTVQGPGGITLGTGVTRTVTGTFRTAAIVTNAGQLTLSGTAQLDAGGVFSGSPVYSGSATLVYNAGYTVANEWAAGTAVGPGVPRNVTVQAGVGTVTLPSTNRTVPGNLGITSGTLALSGGDLAVGGNWTQGGSFQPNGRTVTFNGVGTQTISAAAGESFARLVVDKSSGNLTHSSSPPTHVEINGASGDVLQISNVGGIDLGGNTLTLSGAGGNLRVSGGTGSRTITGNGVLAFTGAKTITSQGGRTLTLGANVITRLAGAAVDFGPSLTTLQGVLEIAPAGSVTTNPPIYASGSTLRYAAGSTFGRDVEWSALSGPGAPWHVAVTANTVLDLGSGAPGVAREVAGNLAIGTGSTLTMNGAGNAMTAPLTVRGQLTVDGSMTLSSAAGGALVLHGGLAVAGSLGQNQRTVSFLGNADQTVAGSGVVSLDDVRIAKTGGSVRLLADLTLGASTGGHSLEFNGSADVLELNGRTLTLSATLGGSNPGGIFRGSATSRMAIVGAGDFGPVRFGNGSQTLQSLTVDRSGPGRVVLGTPLVVGGMLTLANGFLIPGADTLTIGPGGTVTRTAGHVVGPLRKRIPTGPTSVAFEIGSEAGYTPVQVTFGNVSTAGNLTAHTTGTAHPQVASSGIVAGRSANRYYTLVNAGTAFNQYAATFHFLPGDVDAGADPLLFDVLKYTAPDWSGTQRGNVTATSVQATGLTSFSDFAIGELVTHTITASAGPNGAISPAGAVSVRDRGSQAFVITPAAGYHIQDVLVDGVSIGPAPGYTFTNVTADHTISASFEINVYTLNIQVNGFGSYTRNPDQPTYPHGTTVVLTAIPGVGQKFVHWASDFINTHNPLHHTVTVSRTITAVFQRDPLSYTRTTFVGTYDPISEAGGAVPIIVSADDSVRSIPLPFPFVYSGLSFTTQNYLAISANGFVFPSRTEVTSSLSTQGNNVNLYTATFPNATIAPWYDNLRVHTQGKVLYQTRGTPGNRTLAVQWTNVNSFTSSTGGTPRLINFQAILYEGTNVIEFRYGPISGTSSSLESASIGLEDSLGGSNSYLDAVTGSRIMNNGMLTTNKWPVRFLRFTPGAPTSIPAGTYEVGIGRTYPSLSEAVADLNHRGISGSVTFELMDAVYDSSAARGGNVFPILVSSVPGASATNTITIRAAGTGIVTVRHRGTDAGLCGNETLINAIDTTNEPVIGLVGSDYVQLRNLLLEGGPTVDRGLLLIPSSPVNGAQDNTAENLGIVLNRTNTLSVGVQQFQPVSPTNDAGTNSRNRYFNLAISNVYAGISLAGNAARPDAGCEVGTFGGASTVGGPSPGDIGGGTTQTFGIRATNQRDVRIFNTEVRNITGTGSGTVDGIFLDNLGSTSASSGTCEIFGNRVRDLENTSTSAGRVNGIRVNLTKNASSVSRIYNNFVYRLNTSSTSTSGRRLVGISVQEQGGGEGATHNVDFNSVHLGASATASSNSCFEIGTFIGPVIRVRNNVFANFVGTQSGTGKHYCWATPGGGIGAPGSVSDHNILHISNVANGFVGVSALEDRASLADWQTVAHSDSNSLTANPGFVSSSDLHINPSRPTPVEGRGSYFGGAISWVGQDIDGEARNASTPDIGADEGSFLQQQVNDIAASAFVDPVPSAVKFVSTSLTPQATFENAGTDPQVNIPVRFRIKGPTPSTAVAYNQTSTIPSLIAGASAVVSFPAATIGVTGFYTMEAVAELPNEDVPANDLISGSFEVAGPLSGSYRVGAAEPFPFDKLTNAVNRLNTVGVSGPTTFLLRDTNYGVGETFPITVRSIPGAGVDRTTTIRPDVGISTQLTGNSSKAVMVLDGVDHFVLDGSSAGSSSRNLTIRNTSASEASAVVWGQTTLGGDPITNVTVRNLILVGNDNTQTLFGVGFGGSTIGLISNGNLNHGNRVENCQIRRTQYGIYSAGLNAGFKNTGTVIRGNDLSVVTPDNIAIGGILVRFEDGLQVTGNRIGGLSASAAIGAFGIALGMRNIASETFGGDEVTNATVARNLIVGVTSTHADGLSAAGITLAPATSGVTTIANNMIAGVTSPARDPDMTVGIVIGGGSGSTTRLYFNSVALTGNRGFATAPSFALAIGGTDPTVDVRNNILLNTMTSTSVGPSYAIGLAYGPPYLRLTSDRNDLYAPGSPLAIVGGLLNDEFGELANLAAWRTETGKDGNSVSGDPLFASATDLHIGQSGSPVVGAGVPIAGITTDFDGETGNRATTPNIGADEFGTHSLNATVVGNGSVTRNPDATNYIFGSVVQLTAVPAAGYQFNGWSGDATGSTNPIVVTMNRDKSVTATFAAERHSLDVTVVGGGVVARNPNQASFAHGDSVVLTAAPLPGRHFVKWSGDARGSQNPHIVHMDGPKSIVATFSGTTLPLDVMVAGSGTVSRIPDQASYDPGTAVFLTATPAIGNHFAGFSGDESGAAETLTVVMSAPKSVTATFEVSTYPLDVSVVGNGTVVKDPDQGSYEHGTAVQLVAVAEVGSHFVAWSGATASNSDTIVVAMDAPKNLTATFEVDSFALDVAVVGNGEVTRSPDQPTYAYGTAVLLTAKPGTGYHFEGYSGDASGSADTLTVRVDGSKSVTARFEINTYSIFVNVVGRGTVIRDPDLPSYPHGTSVRLTALPGSGSNFVQWTGSVIGSANTVIVVMDRSKGLIATFSSSTNALNVFVTGSGSVVRSPDRASFDPGTAVLLTATSSPGSRFVGYSGDATGSTDTLTVVMDAPKTVSATFQLITHALDVAVVGDGAVSKNPDLAAYAAGTLVLLTATPGGGSHFVGWSGDAAGSKNPIDVVMDGPRSVTATFSSLAFPLDLAVIGSGTVARSPDQASFDPGTAVLLTATPAAGYHFSGWSGDASGSTDTVTVLVDGPKSVTATFELNRYPLDVTVVGNGLVTREPDDLTYVHGTTVLLDAFPQIGYHFVGWSGDTTSFSDTLIVLMDRPLSVTATFEINTHPLAVSVTGGGTVAKSPDLPSYTQGTAVKLTAMPDAGYHFVGWSGDTTSAADTLTVVMRSPKSLTATFQINTYVLNVSAVGNGKISRSPDQATYDHGTAVRLRAYPAVGNHLVGYSGDAIGSADTITVVMTGPKSVTATFAVNTYALAVSVVGDGAVSKNPNQAVYDHGTTVELNATPAGEFVKWSGDVVGSANPISVFMGGPKSVSATFSTLAHPLDVTVVGNGSVERTPDQASYDPGTAVLLTATPALGHKFVGWSGDTASAADTLTVTMNRSRSITATFELIGTYTLDITIVGPGSVLKSPDQPTYDHGTVVFLTATANVGYHFVGWSGDGSGSDKPLSLVMDGPKNVTATFAINSYLLEVTLVGGGAVARAPNQASYEHGTSVSLTATPAVGYHFDGWSGAVSGTANPVALTMEAPKSVTATFAIDRYSVDVVAVGSGFVTRNPDQALYDFGSTVTLTAAPGPGHHLAGWSGDATGSDNPLVATVDRNLNIVATFEINSYVLDVNVVDDGTVTKSPQQPSYLHGDKVILTATPAAGHHFVGWSGDAGGAFNPLSVLMDRDKNITATFAIDTYALDVSAVGNGLVTKTPNQTAYEHGTAVRLVPTPAVGHYFVGWTGDTVTAADTLDVVMVANRAYTATFAPNTYTLDVNQVGSGTVTKSPDQGLYEHGTEVLLVAVPAPGHHFAGWSGDTTSVSDTLSLVMTGDRSFTATFESDRYTLTVALVGSGSVTKSPERVSYDHGTPVILTATTHVGYHFVGWSGDATGASDTITVVMDSDKTVTATFAINRYALSVTTVGNGIVNRSPDEALYDHGTAVTLGANAGFGYTFTGWSGDATGVENPIAIVMDGPKTVTATFEINSYSLDVSLVGSGTVTKNPNLPKYVHGTAVELSAAADSGYVFLDWLGDASGSDNPLPVVMDGNKSITARFKPTSFTVDVIVVGGSGRVDRFPDQPRYDPGTKVDLTFYPDTGYQFVRWTYNVGDTVDINPMSVTVDSVLTVTATLVQAPPPTLTVRIVGSGTVTREPDRPFYQGEWVYLTATPDSAHRFAGWEGTRTPLWNPLPVFVSRDTEISAIFEPTFRTLSASTVLGSGTVTRNPDQLGYAPGTQVEITAVPDSGYHFMEWRGDTATSVNPLTVLMDRNWTIGAAFGFEVSVAVVGGGGVIRVPNRTVFAPGDSVVLAAIPESGFRFVGWSGDTTSTDKWLTLPVHRDRNVTATFSAIEHRLEVVVLGNGTVTKIPDQETYSDGSQVLLLATPSPGWHFVGWSEPSGDRTVRRHADGSPPPCEHCATGAANPLALVMSYSRTVIAAFAINTFTLDVTVIGGGRVLKNPDLEGYEPGTTVELTAVPDSGLVFLGWGGDTSGIDNPLAVLMNRDWTLTAHFGSSLSALLVDVVGGGSVTETRLRGADGRGWFVELQAVPDAGWRFFEWSGDASGGENPLRVSRVLGQRITATFVEAVAPVVRLSPAGPLIVGRTVTIEWAATDDVGVTSVDVTLSRSGSLGTYEVIVEGVENTGSYRWNVTGPAAAAVHVRVVARDAAGNAGSDMVSTRILAEPVLNFALDSPSPNPTRGAANIGFELPRDSRVRLCVIDVQGREVAVLADEILGAGRYQRVWTGQTERGPAPAGVYFVRLQTSGAHLTRRLLLAR